MYDLKYNMLNLKMEMIRLWINRYVSYDFMIRVVLNIIPKFGYGGLSIHKTEYKIV